MNIITNADVDKFIDLFKVGMQAGEQKDLKANASRIGEKYYVSMKFKFEVDAAFIETAFTEEEPLYLQKIGRISREFK